MPSMNTPVHEEANRQTLLLIQEINQYQRLMDRGRSLQGTPSIHRPSSNLYIKNLDDWVVSVETLDGDFDIDELLARELATRVVNNLLDAGWLKDYLSRSPGDNGGFREHLSSAAIGPGNILSTTNEVRKAAEAGLSSRSFEKASQKITTGKAQSVKINNHMTLYNANKSGKGPPRIRMRITGLPTKVVSPAVNPGDLRMYRNGAFSVRVGTVKSMTGVTAMTSKARFLNLKGVGGILTFAPSAAIDLHNNFNDGSFNGRQFVIDQAKHQSGNLVGWGVGALIIFVGGTAAPVLIVSLIAGVALQALWNYSGAADWLGRQAENIIATD